jgi:ATP-binding cassette subfamily B protein
LETSNGSESFTPRPWVARTLALFRPYWKDVLVAALLLVVSSALTLTGPLVLRHAIDTDVAQKDLAALGRTSVFYVLLLLSLVATTWAQRCQLNRIGHGAMATLRCRLLRRIAALPVTVHDEQPSGKLMTRVMGDVDALRELMTGTFLALMGDIVLFVAMAGVMLWIDWKLASIALGLLPFLAVGFVFFQKTAGPRFAAARARAADLNGFLAEHLRAMPVLQALDRTGWARARCRALGQERFDADTGAERIVISYFNSITMTEALGTATILLVGSTRVASGSLTVGTLILFFEYVRRYYEPVHRLSEQLHTLERARASASRIYSLLDREPEPDLIDAGGLPATPALAAPMPGEVRFEDVWFSYKPEPTEDSWILRGVSFTVPVGAHFALVGPTGHGKSTILSLLLRFHVAQKGRVLVDGEDVRSVPLETLRGRFGLVLQDVRLFPGTLADNVLLGRPGGKEAAEKALESVGALDLVGRLPDGLETVLGDGGDGLSYGERQLVACARALAREPRILLLDEATSSVDPKTESLLQTALERVSRGRTSVTIAHRLATVRGSDRILFVERGQIVEEGTRQELLARAGRYAALERLQAFEAHEPLEPTPPRGSPRPQEAALHG